jgi:hemoglobin
MRIWRPRHYWAFLAIILASCGGIKPIRADELLDAFGGKAGLVRLADRVVDRVLADDRIKQRFARTNLPRLRRLLAEQFCAQLGGGCVYTGRDMAESHQHLDLKDREFNALVEDLQLAMDDEHIDFADQNKLIARLAPMKRDIIAN